MPASYSQTPSSLSNKNFRHYRHLRNVCQASLSAGYFIWRFFRPITTQMGGLAEPSLRTSNDHSLIVRVP